jgi:hypothetical protein
MKSRPFVVCGSVSLLTALVSLVSCIRAAAQTNTEEALDSKVPTGLYASGTSTFTTFTLRLETNGNYQVLAELGRPIGSQKQEGTWRWNALKHEFLLKPTTNKGAFNFEFHRLRVDKQETNTLQWIPLRGVGGPGGAVEGAIDYIRFKRKAE